MLAALVIAAVTAAPAATDAEPGLVIDAQGFPYPSVNAAMDALIENREARITVRAGWTLVDEVVDGRPVNWSFTPGSHPAHPSAVRRAPVEQDGDVQVQLTYRCEARPEACESLLQEFRRRNPAMVTEFKRRLGLLDHPRQAEAVEFAERWLDLKERGNDDETLALLTTYSRTGYTPVEWRRIMEEERRKRGALQLRRLSRVALLENPPGAEPEGTLALIEFEAIYENIPLERIRLYLHAGQGTPFRVMRDEGPNVRFFRVPR